MGRMAAEALLARMVSGEEPGDTEVIVPTTLVVRGSTVQPDRGGSALLN